MSAFEAISIGANWLGFAMFALAAVALVGLATLYLTDFLVSKVFARLRRLYHLSSISYWLHHHEQRGRKCFLDPEITKEK